MKKTVFFIITLLLAVLMVSAAGAAGEGWTREGSRLLYYKNGKPVTGQQTIDGRVYHFTSPEGYLKGNGQVQYTNYDDYYFINSSNEITTGWQTVSGDKYYFDPETGKAYTYYRGDNGAQIINGVPYSFDSEGKLLVDRWYYSLYGDQNGHALSGYQTVNGKNYFFSDTGLAQTGFQQINGKIHYFYDSWPYSERSEAHGWVKVNSSIFYLDPSSGMLQTDPRTIDGTAYTFNDDGSLKHSSSVVLKFEAGWYGYDASNEPLSGWASINGATYYCNYSGKAYIGRYSIESDYYYFDSEGKMQTGWQKHKWHDDWEENWYYYDENGKAVWGWLTLDGATYYIKSYSGLLHDGVYDLEKDGDWAYFVFDSDGKLIGERSYINWIYRGWFQDEDLGPDSWAYADENGYALVGMNKVDGVWYLFDHDGIMQTGWINYDGKWYCASSGGSLYVSSWMKEGNTWYYFLSTGEMATGWTRINGTMYYFSGSGAMQTGWIRDGGRWYYLTGSGSMVKGWMQEGKTWYYFDSDGAMVTGWVNAGGTQYYFGSGGAMQTGWVKDNGNWYYLSGSGAMAKGWVQDGSSWYYFNSDGTMATGWIREGGTWYYFTSGGAMATGWKKIDNEWHYFQSSGAMKTGWFKDSDGSWYWFDGDGNMAVGLTKIDGKEEVFSQGGVWQYTAP